MDSAETTARRARGRRRGPERGRGRRLAPPWRRALLAVHVVCSVGLLGADGTVLSLDIAGRVGSDPHASYPAAHLIGEVVLLPLVLLSLLTGVAMGLLTPWGLFRHWWVLAKLLLTTGGSVLATFVLLPTLDDAAAAGRAGHAFGGSLGLVRDSSGATGVLLITVALAYVKPFGRIRRSRDRHG